MESKYISANEMAARINAALKVNGYSAAEAWASTNGADCVRIAGKKACGEVKRPTNSTDPWVAADIRHMMLHRIVSEVLVSAYAK